VIRLWSQADRLHLHREAEITRIDLSGPLLDLLAWGGDPRTFDWFERPPAGALDAAFDLLARLNATAHGEITEFGRTLQRLPLSPRLGSILLAANGAREAAIACALLSERGFQRTAGDAATTSNDLATAVDRVRDLPAHVIKAATVLQSFVGVGASDRRTIDESALRRAVLAGYPDRVGRRRTPGSQRVLLASGHGAVVGPESGVRGGEFLVALDVSAGKRGEGSEARIRLAAIVDRDWLKPTHTRPEHHLDEEAGAVRAASRDYYGAIVLDERPQPPDPDEASRLLAGGYLARPRTDNDLQLLRRLRFAGRDVDVHDLVTRAAAGHRLLKDVDLSSGLSPDQRRRLDQHAPQFLRLPSGRQMRLEYQDDGSVRPGRHPTNRIPPRAAAPLPPGAERTTRPDDPRPPKLLGTHVSRSTQRASRQVSQARMA
jgi:ATP-dependent helicase HrpB